MDGIPACKFCTSIGIPCRTSPRQRQRAKKTTSRVATAASSATRIEPATASARVEDVGKRTTSPVRRMRLAKSASSLDGPRLLGVPGLTRQALDNCVDTYFETIGLCLSLSQTSTVFRRRMRVQLYNSAGLDVPAELADISHDPASRLLILAVTCRGAFFCSHASLVRELYDQCCEILSNPDAVTTDYLDTMDAILLLSELTLQPRHATPNILDPLGKLAVVDIALFHKLHIPPPFTSPDFQRRLELWARIWIHDALRSASAHVCYLIADNDSGWPLPPNYEDYPFIVLTLVTRDICRTLLSPKAKGLGISDEDVERVLAGLAGLRARMKVDVKRLKACLAPGATPENEPLYPLNGDKPIAPMEQLFILSIHDWLYLVVWVAVQEYTERHPDKLSASAVINTESATMAACEDMATLAQISAPHGLHVRGPRGIRNHMAAFALFLVRVFTSIPNPTVEQTSQYISLAETLNYGVRSATYYPDSEVLADTLRMALFRATRVGIKDAARVAERGLEGLPPDNESPLPDDAPHGPTDPLASLTGPPQQHAEAVPPTVPASQTAQVPVLQQPLPPVMNTGFPTTSQTYVAPGDGSTTWADPNTTNAALQDAQPVVLDTNHVAQPSVPLDWYGFMDTLKECGFEMPLSSMSF